MNLKFKDNTTLYYRKPSLVDKRDDCYLLIWGELGQWLNIDNELFNLLNSFESETSMRRIVEKYAQNNKRQPLKKIEKNIRDIIKELLTRDIISLKNAPSGDHDNFIKIFNVTINLTNRCNLKCAWCYNSERISNEIPVERLISAIDKGKNLFSKDVSFIILGGEPFLDPEKLFKLLDYITVNFKTPPIVSTNGTLLAESVIERLKNKKVEIQVSLDSSIEEKHDELRGQGVYKKAVKAIEGLVDVGVYTMISMVYSRNSIEEFGPYLKLAKKLKVDEARFIPLRIIGKGIKYKKDIPNQSIAYKHLMEVLEKNPEYKTLLKRDFFTISTTVCSYSAHRANCGLGYKVIFIDADGKIYPCPNHIKESDFCGDLNNEDLACIIEDSEVMKRTRKVYLTSNYLSCKSCFFKHWCAGDCRGEVVALGKNKLSPSPHCQEYQKMYLQMFWDISKERSLSGKNKINNEFI